MGRYASNRVVFLFLINFNKYKYIIVLTGRTLGCLAPKSHSVFPAVLSFLLIPFIVFSRLPEFEKTVQSGTHFEIILLSYRIIQN
jgi:hypothetical protein